MKFETAMKMYEYIRDNGDLYSPSEEIYVFLYSEDGAICSYDITNEQAKELSALSKEHDGEYWGAFLGFGGSIHDPSDRWADVDPCPFEKDLEHNPALQFCEQYHTVADWEAV